MEIDVTEMVMEAIFGHDNNNEITFRLNALPGGSMTKFFSREADNPSLRPVLIFKEVTSIPIARDDTYSVKIDDILRVGAPGVMSNDESLDGFPLTAFLETRPNYGNVTFHSDGSFVYYYDSESFADRTDHFTYAVIDGFDMSIATVSIRLAPPNHPPYVYENNGTMVYQGQSCFLPVYGFDVDGDPLTYIIVSGPYHGTLNSSWVYTPDPDFVGTDGISFRAYDGKAYSRIGFIGIDVSPALFYE